MVVEGDFMDVRLGRPDSQPEPELNVPANSNAPSHSAKSETHAEPEAEASTSAGTGMETGVNDRRVRLREEGIVSPRRTESRWWSRVGKRQDERKPVNTFCLIGPPRQVRPSFPRRVQPVQTTLPTEGQLNVSMTEEGPSGEYQMTVQRDRQGRWIPTTGERTMTIGKTREGRRNFYVGESKELGTFSIASAEASPLKG